MRIPDRLRSSTPCFSFEFFPAFASVTYGAGGSNRQRTIEVATRIKAETGIEPMAHLAAVGHTRGEIAEILDRLAHAGVENVLCLRGDPPRDQPVLYGVADGLRYASDLVSFARGGPWGFSLGGACYPEGHLENPSRDDDLRALKVKVDAGAEFLITQLFFDNRDFYDFRERCDLAGIKVPIIVGIMPVGTKAGLVRMAELALGARVPAGLLRAVNRCADDAAVAKVGVQWATEQCRHLLDNNVRGIHFYTLNKSDATREIYQNLGVADSVALRG
jgi:methylenetetrahydrofolate reductase (NADPH)